jgi:hypothetical protein
MPVTVSTTLSAGAPRGLRGNARPSACRHSSTPTRSACVYVCMYVYTYVCMYVCMHACMHVCMHTYMHTYIHAYKHTYIHAYMHTYMHTCIHTNIHTYMHTCIHTCTHTYMHACIHTCTHIDRQIGRHRQTRQWVEVEAVFSAENKSSEATQSVSHKFITQGGDTRS